MYSEIATLGAVTGTLAVLLASGSPLTSWHTIVTDFGFPITLVVFLLWGLWKREERGEKNAIEREGRIANRVTELEHFMQNELLDMNKQGVQAIADNTAALNRLVTALETRPCLCEGEGLLNQLNTMAEKIDKLAAATGNA